MNLLRHFIEYSTHCRLSPFWMKASKVIIHLMVELRLFVDIPNLFLLIAGGDGTVCSVLNFVKTIPQWQLSNPPAAILPLGTGNDLSRSLGWGGSIEDVDAG